MTFELWRIFSIRYFKHRPGNFPVKVSDIDCPLDTFISSLQKLSCDAPFLTFLSINDCRFPSQHYLALGDLPNLAVLLLWETGRAAYPNGFSKRVLRAWRDAATEKRSFSSLRAVQMTDFGIEADRLLAYFEPFRKLSLCRILPSEGKHGRSGGTGSWKYLSK